MTLATVVIDQRGTHLDLAAKNVLEIVEPSGTKQRIGLLGVNRILIHGDIKLSSSLLRNCQEIGVGIIVFSSRGGFFAAHHLSHYPGSIKLRLQQFKAYGDEKQRLQLAKLMIADKIDKQMRYLELYGIDSGLERFLDSLAQAAKLSELMGVEGAAAARYFKRWEAAWKSPWLFSGRTRRPPQDPVNALLSLSYTLALNTVGQLAGSFGLDIYVGFIHVPQSNRPALALDLLEPIRPAIDYWVWQFLQTAILKPEHFTQSQMEGVRLNKEGRALYYQHWFHDEQNWLRKASRASLARILNALRVIKT